MFYAEVFDKAESVWREIKDTIISLEKEAFVVEPFTEEILEKDFLDPETIVVLLKSPVLSEPIGFAYAKPMEPETSDGPAKPGETAWMWDTVIQTEYRGKGLLKIMMQKLEDELKSRGFKYLERNARVENNFANNIAKHYKDRIIKSFPLDSQWGPQVFFRIKL